MPLRLTAQPPVASDSSEAPLEPYEGLDQRVDRTDRWDDLGAHIAQILKRVHEQAAVVRLSAAADANAATSAAERDRIAARDALAEAELWAASRRAQAEADAEQIVAEAQERARCHVAEVLRRAESDLASLSSMLGDTGARLQAIHDLVSVTVERDAAEHDFDDPASLVSVTNRG